MEIMVTTMLGAYALYFILLAVAIVMQVLIAIAIYRDAKAYGRDDAMLFAVLAGLFGMIPVAVYLAVRGRHKGVAVCPTCSAQYGNIDITKPNILMCSQCGSQLQLYTAQLTEEQMLAARKGEKINKALTTIAIIYFVIYPIIIAAYCYLVFSVVWSSAYMY